MYGVTGCVDIDIQQSKPCILHTMVLGILARIVRKVIKMMNNEGLEVSRSLFSSDVLKLGQHHRLRQFVDKILNYDKYQANGDDFETILPALNTLFDQVCDFQLIFPP